MEPLVKRAWGRRVGLPLREGLFAAVQIFAGRNGLRKSVHCGLLLDGNEQELSLENRVSSLICREQPGSKVKRGMACHWTVMRLSTRGRAGRARNERVSSELHVGYPGYRKRSQRAHQPRECVQSAH